MGLLEKAGKIKEDVKPKKAAKKVKKAEPKPVKQAKIAKAKAKPKKEQRERKPRDPRVMPDGFKLAGKAARFARRLVDFIVTYGATFGVLAAFAMIDSDFTYMWIGAFAVMAFNLFFLPAKTNRTVGMFLTRTRYVNSRGSHPFFVHQILSSMTALYIITAMILIAIGAPQAERGADWVLISIGIVFALIPFSDYIVTKLRAANGQTQSMYDAMFGCWFVVAERTDSADSGSWMSRLESLGDWGDKRGWSGSADEDEEDASND